jgi:DNA-binding MarR family transcriptional regulator
MALASAHITPRRRGALSAANRKGGDAAGNGSADTAFRSLIKTLGLLKRVMEPYFSRFGISGSQWGVLVTLHRAADEGEPSLRLTDLGDRLLVRPPSVTGVVDRLERMGLVARTESPSDHRSKLVSLTAGGKDLVRRVLEEHPAQVQQALAGLSEGEQVEFQHLLERLSSHLEGLPENGSGHTRPGASAGPRRA